MLSEKLLKAHEEICKDCFVGFDGFCDEIIDLIDKRHDSENYTPLPTIEAFGKRILSAKGVSGNLELVTKQIKIGGNAPILANALQNSQHRIYFAGTIGTKNQIEPLFADFAARCERVIPLGPSGHSDALEFSDGKIILGKLSSLFHIDYRTLLAAVSEDELVNLLNKAALFATVNWTMLPKMTEIWEGIAQNILPRLKRDKLRWLFVDLCDPAKRSETDLQRAMEVLASFSSVYQVVLGLNRAEAKHLGDVYGISSDAKALQRKLGLSQVVIHSAGVSKAASDDGNEFEFRAAVCKTPKLTTGAGDNFNAGYCNGLLYGFSVQECLELAMTTAGFYVRKGRSPNVKELVKSLSNSSNEVI